MTPQRHLRFQRHLPLITPRIVFKRAAPPPLPTITPRRVFHPETFRRDASDDGSGSDGSREPRPAEHRLDHNHDLDAGSQDGDSDHPRDPSPPGGGPSRAERVPVRARPASNKIPKPPGEPGRPGSGGYCIDIALTKTHGWSDESVDKLTVGINRSHSLDYTDSDFL